MGKASWLIVMPPACGCRVHADKLCRFMLLSPTPTPTLAAPKTPKEKHWHPHILTSSYRTHQDKRTHERRSPQLDPKTSEDPGPPCGVLFATEVCPSYCADDEVGPSVGHQFRVPWGISGWEKYYGYTTWAK